MNTPQWLNKLERKFGRYAVPGLMNIMITGMVIVWVMDNIICPASGKMQLTPLISFSREAVLQGQIWRILSFIFVPIDASAFFLIFTMYFYWLIGSVMESQWGTFRFNAYYLCGVLGTIVSGFITGSASNYYLTMSLFIAFATIAPNFQMMLFFIIPVKIKYLAMLSGVVLAISFIMSGWSGKLAIIMSLINLVIFFGKDFAEIVRMRVHHWKYKINNRK